MVAWKVHTDKERNEPIENFVKVQREVVKVIFLVLIIWLFIFFCLYESMSVTLTEEKREKKKEKKIIRKKFAEMPRAKKKNGESD